MGRTIELGLIDEFLARAAAEGGSLLLAGEPGAGKTALLQAAADRARGRGNPGGAGRGRRVRDDERFLGAEPDPDSPVGRAGDAPARCTGTRWTVVLGAGRRRAAEASLQVAQAALNLIRAMAARRPLLLVVDDLQWMDRSSADVLSFVVRRLGGSRAGFLAAARTGDARRLRAREHDPS